MVLSYPERFRWKYVALYAVVLLTLQLAEGTNVYFAGLVSVYIFLFTWAFNIAGGLTYSSGSFIFFTGTLVCLTGVTYKCLTGEAGDSHLSSPVTTMLIYCVGMLGLGVAAFACRKLRYKRGYMSDIASGEAMLQSAVGCLILGVVLSVAFGGGYGNAGSIASAVNQINRFTQLSILLATTYEVKKSNGARGFNWVSILAIGFTFAGGIIYSSKEGMLIGPVTWLLTAWAAGYNFRSKQAILGGVFLWFMLYYMIPYSQYVRSFRAEGGDRAANTKVAQEYIFKLNEVRKLNVEISNEDAYLSAPHFYDHEQGFVERMAMIAYDDALITLTKEGSVFGLYPVYHAYINVIPHFIWPDKPVFFTANTYGHEVGVIGDEDLTTGISFSPISDTYHEAEWFGVIVIFPVVLFMYFMVMDSLTGSTKYSPWPLLVIALNAHVAPEGLLDGVVLQTTYGAFGILLLALTVKFLFPLVHKVVTSGNKTSIRRTIDFNLGKDALVRPLPERVVTDL